MEESEPEAEWWRWALMPLACLAGAFIAFLIFPWFEKSVYSKLGEADQISPGGAPIFMAGLFGYAYSWIAYKMAPSSKFKAGGTMLGVLALISAGGVAAAWTIWRVESPWSVAGAASAMLATATISLFHCHAMATNPEAVYRDWERYERSWWRLLGGRRRGPWWWP